MGSVKKGAAAMDIFKRTDRDYEFKKAQPSNGPSPHCNQFSPKVHFVKPLAPRLADSHLPRFLDREHSVKIQKILKNPRLDLHEGEHNIYGKNPKCKQCQEKLKKVEQQWLIKPLLGSMYATTIYNETRERLSPKGKTDRNLSVSKLSEGGFGKNEQSIQQLMEVDGDDSPSKQPESPDASPKASQGEK